MCKYKNKQMLENELRQAEERVSLLKSNDGDFREIHKEEILIFNSKLLLEIIKRFYENKNKPIGSNGFLQSPDNEEEILIDLTHHEIFINIPINKYSNLGHGKSYIQKTGSIIEYFLPQLVLLEAEIYLFNKDNEVIKLPISSNDIYKTSEIGDNNLPYYIFRANIYKFAEEIKEARYIFISFKEVK